MLNIRLLKVNPQKYIVEIYRNNKLIILREMKTDDYLDVIESIEPILKCNADCRDELK
jgi:hypothetical protein